MRPEMVKWAGSRQPALWLSGVAPIVRLMRALQVYHLGNAQMGTVGSRCLESAPSMWAAFTSHSSPIQRDSARHLGTNWSDLPKFHSPQIQ